MKNILIFLIPFFLFSCNKAESIGDLSYLVEIAEESEEVYYSPQKRVPPTPFTNQNDSIKKKIIKDGHMEIEVSELEKTKHDIDSILQNYNGYYANENLNNSDWEMSYTLSIRVPSRYFENLILNIEKGNGKITSKEIDTRDVTSKFIDLETRLKNKKKYLKTYTDLLKQAKTVKDVLEIQDKTREIEEEIESKTGQLKYLKDQVAYSTLNLEISAPKISKPAPPITFITKVKDSLSDGWNGFLNMVLFVINIWPIWILLLFVFILWKRRKKSKMN